VTQATGAIRNRHLLRSDAKARHDKMAEQVNRMLDPSVVSELALRNSKGQALHKHLLKEVAHESEPI
jgi:hypothetical protein